MARDVIIRYVGDASSAVRASKRLGDETSKLERILGARFGKIGDQFKKLGKTAAFGLAGAGDLFVGDGLLASARLVAVDAP